MKTSKLTSYQFNGLVNVLLDVEIAANEAEERLNGVMSEKDYRKLSMLPDKMRRRFIKAYNKAQGAVTMFNFEIEAANDWINDQL